MMMTTMVMIIIIIIMTTMIMMFQYIYLQFWPNDSHKQSRYVVLNLRDERIAYISYCN
jgi:hypothetical protein